MKKGLSILLILAMMVGMLAGCSTGNTADSKQANALKDGTYEGTGKGNNGDIKVEMKVEGGKIASVTVLEHGETPGIADAALERIPQAIVDAQSIAVDTVSGATNSSKGIIEAVRSCIEQAGGNPADFEVAVEDGNDEVQVTEESVDVLVVGGGGAGLQSALRAIESGKTVTLIEKNGSLGGATISNGSNIVATGSELSKELFGDNGDSPEILYEDLNKGCKGTLKTELTTKMTVTIGQAIDWVSQAAGLKYGIAQTQVVDHSIDRQVELASSSSKELIEAGSKKFEELGGKIMLETKAVELVQEDGAVVGVKAEKGNGDIVNFTAKSVIIATGGYGADVDMRPANMDGYLYYGPASSTGDGLKMAIEIGAGSENLDRYKIYPHGWEVEPGIGKLTTYSSKKATDMGAIYVNSQGARLMNESLPYSSFKEKIMEQDNSTAYLVMDEETWNEFYDLLLLHGFNEKTVQGYLEANGSKTPVVVSGSLEEAAKAAGIDAEALTATVEKYNSYAAKGVDEEFGKSAEYLNPIEGEKYYIVEQKVRFATTLGGLVVAENSMAVLDTEGKAIGNLFAAGEVIGGANGNDSLPSMMNSWNLVSAYIAGDFAAQNVDK